MELPQYLGVSLSGGRQERSGLCCLKFHQESARIFLSDLILFPTTSFKSGKSHGDDEILMWVKSQKNAKSIVFDVPISLPPCFQCECDNLRGPLSCPRPDVQWLLKEQKKKTPKRPSTPYTQRPLDFFYETFDKKKFEVSHALGANLAPVVARSLFLKRRLMLPAYEINPRICAYALGKKWGLSFLATQRCFSSVDGSEHRKRLISVLVEKTRLFIYHQDYRSLVSSPHGFSAFLAAFCGYLLDRNEVQESHKYFSHESFIIPSF
ncbi:MAG: hypothetical protein NZ480_00235 [Bdellovibrionaceae bacterium]|nr:hypothetical protein [Pseudobdellovibrionaceae bacterium]MDW8191186.1 hypothetical protein [Pseudobdellovibrionaceae bacterium]